jgi:hypothetical protein
MKLRSAVQEETITWPSNTEPIGCPESSVTSYQPTPRDTPEEQRPQLLHGGNLKYRPQKNTVLKSTTLWPLVLLVMVGRTQGRTSGSEGGTVKENKVLEYSPENRTPACGVKWVFAGRSCHVPGSCVCYRPWTEQRHSLCNDRMYFHTTATWVTSKRVHRRIHYKNKSYSRRSKWQSPSAWMHVSARQNTDLQ